MKFKTSKTLLALSISALASTTALAAPYEVIDLGGLDGDRSVVRDLNEAGQAVGFANGPKDEDGIPEFSEHATLFDTAGNTDLGLLEDGAVSQAIAINDAMKAVGFSNEISTSTDDNGDEITTVNNYAVTFESGTVNKLPSKEELINTQAFDINNNDIIVLSGAFDVDPDDDSNPINRGFVYDSNAGTYTMIEPFTEGARRRTYATSINDNNIVVGFTDAVVEDDINTIKGFFASIDDLPNLTEIPSVDNRAIYPQAINFNNEVVGSIFIPGTRDQREAFYINMSSNPSKPTMLGFLDEAFNDSRANDINNKGQVVGRALISVPTLDEFGAFIYEDGEMKDLNKLVPCNSGWKLTEAVSINNSGQIVGFGAKDGEVRAFRLDPTGEPVEDCGSTDEPSDGGGSVPATLLAILAAAGLRRRFS